MKNRFAGTAALISSVMIGLLPAAGYLPVLASEAESAHVDISIALEGELPDPLEEIDIIIEADDDSYPLPSGAEDGIFEIETKGDSEVSVYFLTGDEDAEEDSVYIEYSRVGVYTYTIYQSSDDFSGTSFDETVYCLEVHVTNIVDEDGNIVGGLQIEYVLVTSGGNSKLDSVSFVNVYPDEEDDDDNGTTTIITTTTTTSGSTVTYYYYIDSDSEEAGEVLAESVEPEVVVEEEEAGEVLAAEKLPQTGQINWPVPVLAAAGLALFGCGFVLIRKSNETELENPL